MLSIIGWLHARKSRWRGLSEFKIPIEYDFFKDCCTTGLILTDCCNCCGPSEEQIIQSKIENDPDYIMSILARNPQFQRSLRYVHQNFRKIWLKAFLREQQGISAFQSAPGTTTNPAFQQSVSSYQSQFQTSITSQPTRTPRTQQSFQNQSFA